MRKMKKVFAGLLACALAVSLLPGQALALGMRGGPAGLSTALQVGSNYYKVAFAGYEWLVIGYSGVGVYSTVEDNAATLLAANYDFGDSSFNNSTADGNAYAKSALQQKMESIAKEFPHQEQALINPRDFSSDDGIAGDGIYGQLLWALSTEEADNEQLTNTLRSYQKQWWLRSPGGFPINAAMVRSSGSVFSNGSNVSYKYGVRPAFNLKLSAYLFVSDASETTGKSAAAVGKGLVSTERTSNTVKFTMKSDSQTLTVDDVDSSYEVVTGNSLSFTYQNATTGSNQYVSCVLTDSVGNVKYYGKLADSSSAAGGSISVPFSGVAPGTYTLKIFSEEANGPLYTDFCSEPVTTTVTVQHAQHSWSPTWNSDDTHHWHECTAAYCPVTDNSQKDGYEEHTYNQKVISDTYLASAATCTDPAEYYYSCVCGAKGTSTFTSGTATGHSWDMSVWDWDWSDDGKTAAVTFTCKNDSSHTEKPAVSITSEVKTPATCTSAGTTTYTARATFGGVEYSDKKDVEDIAATGHSWSGWQSNGNDTHTRACQNQGCTATDTGNCSGGTATCEEQAVCEVCDSEYGELAAHNLIHHDAEQATCTETGTIEYWQCETCGKNFADQAGTEEAASIEVSELGHDVIKVEAKEPTATEQGTLAYWYCERCGKYFADEALTQEITEEDTIIAATEDREEATASTRTGDDSNAAMWAALAALAAAGAIAGFRKKSPVNK